MPSRIWGPYAHGKKWRLIIRNEEGKRTCSDYPTKEDAQCAREEVEQKVRESGSDQPSLARLIQEYLSTAEKTGLSMQTIAKRTLRLKSWFGLYLSMNEVTRPRLESYYRERTRQVAAATHHQELIVAKVFLKWCVERGYIRKNPAEDIKPVGRANKGKKRLRAGEAKKLLEWCLDNGDRYVPVVCALLLGLRAGEILALTKRDIDSVDGRVICWVDHGKTINSERRLDVPRPIAGVLARLAMQCTERLFDIRKTTLARITREACEGAGVMVVCPHGLRATWATLAAETGAVTHQVAAALGHGGTTVTEQHYITHGSIQTARANRVVDLIGNDLTADSSRAVPADDNRPKDNVDFSGVV